MENSGIFYFSSTGNSLYIAKKVKEKFGGKILYVPAYDGDGAEFEKIFIVPPIYSFGMPVPILHLLSRLNTDAEIAEILAAVERQAYRIPKEKRTKEKTYLKNKANWHTIGERFSVSDACVQCGKCVSLCPVQNITLTNGKIAFADKCIACLGCFHRCPQKAILYKNKGNKKQYVNPNIDETEIGKNFG